MYWVIEYKNGKNISEFETSFSLANKENIRALYFQTQSDRYGVLDNGYFFINDTEYNFKVGNKPHKYIQFKTASFVFDEKSKSKIDSWNLGYEIHNSNGYEKYIMTITIENEVFFIAQRFNLQSNMIGERKMRLQ